MKANIEQLEYLVSEMKKIAAEHPKATIYYDWEGGEIRITYPLPRDFKILQESIPKSLEVKNDH